MSHRAEPKNAGVRAKGGAGDDETDDRKDTKGTEYTNTGAKKTDADAKNTGAEEKDAEGANAAAEPKVNRLCFTCNGQEFVTALVNGNIGDLKLGIEPALERVIHFITQLKTNQNPLNDDDAEAFNNFIKNFDIVNNSSNSADIPKFFTGNVTCTFDTDIDVHADYNPFFPYKIELNNGIDADDDVKEQVLNKHLKNRYSEPSSTGGGKTRKRVRKHKRKQRKSAKRKSSRKRKTK